MGCGGVNGATSAPPAANYNAGGDDGGSTKKTSTPDLMETLQLFLKDMSPDEQARWNDVFAKQGAV